MYKVYIDGEVVHDPSLDDSAALVLDGVVKKAANVADLFTFTAEPGSRAFGKVNKLTSVIEVRKDDEILFRGRATKSTETWTGATAYECEGWFAVFNDTILRPYEYTGSVRGFIQMLVTQHNEQVPAAKQFTLRTVTVTDANDNIVRSSSDYSTTMQALQEKTIGSALGGYLVTEYTGGRWYLDYLADGTGSSGQKITISKNLLDFLREQNAENIATGLIPLGSKNEETDERLTIESVNSGKDYITDAAAVAKYGLIFTTQVWDDVTVASNLLTKAKAALTTLTALIPNITLTAVDLSIMDEDIDPIRFLDYVTVQDDQHDASGSYLVMERTYNLSAPEADTVTFGGTQPSISGASAKTTAEIEGAEARILDNASSRAKAILESSTSGNIYFRYGSDGRVYEVDIMDTADPETAQKIWRWNLGGWGYSGDGGETYTVAATMDGAIVASMITTGILKSDDGTTFYLDLDNGVLKGNFSELKIAGSAAASQSYATSEASTAVSNYDTSLNQQVVFNKLTNNKTNQGIYLSNGNLYINASMINSGYISAARIEANSIAVSKLTGSISNGNWNIDLDAGTFTIGNISAANITTGTLSADRIGANTIAVGKLTGSITGGLSNSWVINLTDGTMTVGNISAANITTGTLAAARIAANSIAVGKLTGSISNGNWKIDLDAGTFTIGNISAANITTGTLDAARIGANSITASKLDVSDLQAIGATIGGFAIDSTSIHTKDVAITSNASNSVGLSSSTFTRTIGGTSRSSLKFAIGSNFGVSNTGVVYADSLYSKSANITGGSINISTTSQTIDVITLDHTLSKTSMTSAGLYVENKSTATNPNMRAVVNGAAIRIQNTSTGKDMSLMAYNSFSLYSGTAGIQTLNLSSSAINLYNAASGKAQSSITLDGFAHSYADGTLVSWLTKTTSGNGALYLYDTNGKMRLGLTDGGLSFYNSSASLIANIMPVVVSTW